MKFPSFAISGVWKDLVGRVTHVCVHAVGTDGLIQKGGKLSVEAAIRLITDGNTVRTIVWNYYASSWNFGAVVTVAGYGLGRRLRAHQDEMVKDNLDNLITMADVL